MEDAQMKRPTLIAVTLSTALSAALVSAQSKTEDKKKPEKPTEKVSVKAGENEVTVSGDGQVIVKAGDTKVEIKGSLGQGSGTVEESDTQIVINGSNQVQVLDCRGRDAVIRGGGNALTLEGECNGVSVVGDSNMVELDTVASITVNGNSNAVRWKRALRGEKPTVKQSGSGNLVLRDER
jgi:hypothetical protein